MSFCDCNCIVSYSFSYKEIIHTCLECESIGGTLGNVNHNVNCKYINCKHCQNYNIENDYDFFQDYNKDEINKFKKNLNQHIKNGDFESAIVYYKDILVVQKWAFHVNTPVFLEAKGLRSEDVMQFLKNIDVGLEDFGKNRKAFEVWLNTH